MTADNDRTNATKDITVAKDPIKIPRPPDRETSRSLEVSGSAIPSKQGRPAFAMGKRGARIGGLLLLVLIATLLAWRFQHPNVVVVVRPIRTT
jgi:hypothetical protein